MLDVTLLSPATQPLIMQDHQVRYVIISAILISQFLLCLRFSFFDISDDASKHFVSNSDLFNWGIFVLFLARRHYSSSQKIYLFIPFERQYPHSPEIDSGTSFQISNPISEI